MPYQSSSLNEAMGQGVSHARNPGRLNNGSITMNAHPDPGLEADSERWAELTPRSVIAKAGVSTEDPADSGYQSYMRQQGNYAPGSFEMLTDQISAGENPEG